MHKSCAVQTIQQGLKPLARPTSLAIDGFPSLGRDPILEPEAIRHKVLDKATIMREQRNIFCPRGDIQARNCNGGRWKIVVAAVTSVMNCVDLAK